MDDGMMAVFQPPFCRSLSAAQKPLVLEGPEMRPSSAILVHRSVVLSTFEQSPLQGAMSREARVSNCTQVTAVLVRIIRGIGSNIQVMTGPLCDSAQPLGLMTLSSEVQKN